jgi:hypothetical protein
VSTAEAAKRIALMAIVVLLWSMCRGHDHRILFLETAAAALGIVIAGVSEEA